MSATPAVIDFVRFTLSPAGFTLSRPRAGHGGLPASPAGRRVGAAFSRLLGS